MFHFFFFLFFYFFFLGWMGEWLNWKLILAHTPRRSETWEWNSVTNLGTERKKRTAKERVRKWNTLTYYTYINMNINKLTIK